MELSLGAIVGLRHILTYRGRYAYDLPTGLWMG